jgi:hypothetical protein
MTLGEVFAPLFEAIRIFIDMIKEAMRKSGL